MVLLRKPLFGLAKRQLPRTLCEGKTCYETASMDAGGFIHYHYFIFTT